MPKRPPRAQPQRVLAAREKEAAALELLRAKMTMAQIAAALGYANASGAWKAIHRALERLPKQEADQLREMSAGRLADLYARTLEILDSDVEPMVKLQAVKVLLRVDESFRRLNGLDQARKVEISGPDGEPIPVELRLRELQERLAAIPADVIDIPAIGEGGDNGVG